MRRGKYDSLGYLIGVVVLASIQLTLLFLVMRVLWKLANKL
jgi:hypothetical protein